MKIKFLKSPIGLGIAHRAGETSVSLPDDVAKMLVEKKFAVIVPEEKPKRTPPVMEKSKRVHPKVQTTVIKKKK